MPLTDIQANRQKALAVALQYEKALCPRLIKLPSNGSLEKLVNMTYNALETNGATLNNGSGDSHGKMTWFKFLVEVIGVPPEYCVVNWKQSTRNEEGGECLFYSLNVCSL
jgi:hypothetical protein